MRAFLLALLILSPLATATAMTPAGTVIRGQAVAMVGVQRYFSNEVETVVSSVCGVSITPNGTRGTPALSAAVPPGGDAYLPYVLTNTGNAPFRFPLAIEHDTATAWTARAATFSLDGNRNGQVDAQEPALQAVELPPGESRHLVLRVAAPSAALGTALLTPVASCPDGSRDDDNLTEIRVEAGPLLALRKYASTAHAMPGSTLTFYLVVANRGSADAVQAVTVSDVLDASGLAGISYLPASAKASAGRVEFSDGATWGAMEPPHVAGVRVVLPELAQGQQVMLQFQARVAPGATPGPRVNTALAEGPGGPARTRFAFEVLPVEEHHLGPNGNAAALPGGDGSEDDVQELPVLIAGQEACGLFSLENAGTAADAYELDTLTLPDGMLGTFRTIAGTPLAMPVFLRPGEQTRFQYCLTAHTLAPDAFELTLNATAIHSGARNTTRLRIGSVQADNAVKLELTASPYPALEAGAILTYTLAVTNTYPFPLTEVVIRNPLPNLQPSTSLQPSFHAASHQGSYDAARQLVTWRIAMVAAGETLTRTLTLDMPKESAEGTTYTLPNAFTLTSAETPNPRVSNQLVHVFPARDLLVDMRVAPRRARIGEALTYTLTVTNPSQRDVLVDIVTAPPHRSRYVPSSARLTTTTGSYAIEPQTQGNQLAWDLRSFNPLTLGPKGSGRDHLTLVYQLTPIPGAADSFTNQAHAEGTTTLAGTTLQLESNHASASAEIRKDAFAHPQALLTGRVFLDQDGNGVYDAQQDLPLPGARLVLANGWQAITDTDGLYAFRQLRPGPWSILLDRHTAPFPPTLRASTTRNPYQRLLTVAGLTVMDFPLQAPTARVHALRTTTLSFGPVTLAKHLEPQPHGTLVVLTLSSSEPLADLTVRDPLPGGGTKLFHFDTFQGEETLTYELPAHAPLTDPDVRWKDSPP